MIPVFINSFNRLSYVEAMLQELERFEGIDSVTIVDNASTYSPLLDFFDKIENSQRHWKLRVNLICLPFNGGPRSSFDVAQRTLDKIQFPYFANTDPDLDLSEIPADFFLRCVAALEKYPEVNKVGASLVLDDIPEDVPLHARILDVESQYWQVKKDEDWYEANLDTHLFVGRTGQSFSYGPGLRSAWCSARHLLWYVTNENKTEEDEFYIRSLSAVHKPGIYWSTIYQDEILPPA